MPVAADERTTRVKTLTLSLMLAAGAVGVTGADQGRRGKDDSAISGRVQIHASRGDDTYFHRRGYTRLNIPLGHYPPPGECRVWFPDRPPGHQPPPGKCHPVPAGAWLIRHPVDNAEHVHVVVYDEQRRDRVLAIGEFRIGTGVFVRVVIEK